MNKNNKVLHFILALILVSGLITDLYSQTLLVSPIEPYMGKIPVGSKALRQVSIFNLGTKNLNITSISLANNPQFKIQNNPGTKTLGIMESFNLELEFTPAQAILSETELTIVDNAPGSPHKFKVSGFGTGTADPTFERIFGTAESDGIGSVQQTQDGGYLLAGSTVPPDQEGGNFYLAKSNMNGEIEWTHDFSSGFSGGIKQAEQTSDGGIIVFGSRQSLQGAKSDLYLAKLNPDRNVVWEKSFGGSEDETPGSILTLANGDFLIVATSRSFTVSTQVYLLKVSKDGNLIWEKNYGGTGGESGKRIIPTKDGNYAVIGSTSSKGSGNYDVYMLKVDSNGNLLWEKTYGGTEWDEGTDIVELTDGSFAVSGFTVSYGVNGNDIYLLKLNSSGDQVWQKTFGDKYQDYGSAVVAVEDGIIISGTLQLQIPPSANSDLLVVKTDLDGNEVWRFQTGGGQNESAGFMLVNNNGNIVIAGSTDSYSSKSDAYFLCINSNGKITGVSQSRNNQLPADIELLQNYPNPFNGQTRITYNLHEQTYVELSLMNVLGVRVDVLESGPMSAGKHTVNLNSDHLASGIYFTVLKTNSKVLVNKMTLLK